MSDTPEWVKIRLEVLRDELRELRAERIAMLESQIADRRKARAIVGSVSAGAAILGIAVYSFGSGGGELATYCLAGAAGGGLWYLDLRRKAAVAEGELRRYMREIGGDAEVQSPTQGAMLD